MFLILSFKFTELSRKMIGWYWGTGCHNVLPMSWETSLHPLTSWRSIYFLIWCQKNYSCGGRTTIKWVLNFLFNSRKRCCQSESFLTFTFHCTEKWVINEVPPTSFWRVEIVPIHRLAHISWIAHKVRWQYQKLFAHSGQCYKKWEEIWTFPNIREIEERVCCDNLTWLKMQSNAIFKQTKLSIAFKINQSCCFSKGGNLDFLQKVYNTSHIWTLVMWGPYTATKLETSHLLQIQIIKM